MVYSDTEGQDMHNGKAPAHRWVGKSGDYRELNTKIEAIAKRHCVVLLCGESGCGKEVLAREIHERSERAGKAFIPVDCANLSGELLSSQLFGHVKGAFTGAHEETLGFFRAADGGTIFLDEIGELPLGVQAKLLRVLQEYRVMPLGATKSEAVDVRVICATNRELEAMVAEGSFRRDLYYRISAVRLGVRPLRARREDIVPLAEYFLARQAAVYDEPVKRLGEEAKRLLEGYDWPGNVRELANAMEHATVFARGSVIRVEELPEQIRIEQAEEAGGGLPSLDEMTRHLIIEALQQTQGRKLKAAAMLGIERRRLNRLLARYEIDIEAVLN